MRLFWVEYQQVPLFGGVFSASVSAAMKDEDQLKSLIATGTRIVRVFELGNAINVTAEFPTGSYRRVIEPAATSANAPETLPAEPKGEAESVDERLQ